MRFLAALALSGCGTLSIEAPASMATRAARPDGCGVAVAPAIDAPSYELLRRVRTSGCFPISDLRKMACSLGADVVVVEPYDPLGRGFGCLDARISYYAAPENR